MALVVIILLLSLSNTFKFMSHIVSVTVVTGMLAISKKTLCPSVVPAL